MIALWIIAAALVLICAVSGVCYRIAFYVSSADRRKGTLIPPGSQFESRKERLRQLQAEFAALPYEEVSLRAADGVLLCGKYYHVRDGAPIQLQMHGYRGSALRDFCGGNRLSRQMGHNALVIDERAHGNSGGRTICFGIRERLDCLAWCRYLQARFPQSPVFLVGVSMGAATVLMASELDLPDTVVGIIADCPYDAPRDIIEKTCRQMKLPPKLVWPFLDLGMRLYGRCRLSDATASAAVAKTKLPVLILHGLDDRMVPYQMSQRIAKACASPCRLELFANAGHGLSCMEDPARYKAAVRQFCEVCLK